MAHWKKFMDKELLGAHDLDGRDITVTIESVSGGEVTGNGNKKNKKPIATLRGTPKKLALNATNCKVIEQLAGTPDVEKWRGVRVTLWPTTTQFGGQTVDCIRIRPYPPKDKPGGKGGKGGAPNAGDELTERIAEEMAKNAAADAGTVPRDTSSDDEPGEEVADA